MNPELPMKGPEVERSRDAGAVRPGTVSEKDGMLGRTKKFLRSKAALGATVLATSFMPFSGADAQQKSRPKLTWEGRRTGTAADRKELRKLYEESKDFLEKYYQSDYFRNKTIYPADSGDVLSQMVAAQDPKLVDDIDSLEKLRDVEKENLTDPDNDEDVSSIKKRLDGLKGQIDSLYGKANHAMDSLSETERYKQVLDSTVGELQAGYLSELNKDIPVVISGKKAPNGDMGRYYREDDEHGASLFISRERGDTAEITTPVHELTHKATEYMLSFSPNSMQALGKEAIDNINENRDSLLMAYPGLDTFYVYLSDPREIISRMSSVRFWLHKHDSAYDVTKPFTEKDYDKLDKNFQTLPSDVQQLMNVFPYKDDFIRDMNTY